MKHNCNYYPVMIKIILPFTLMLLLFSCKTGGPIIIDIPDNNFKNGIYVTIDPRMELLAVVQHFTTWAGDYHTNLNFEYVGEVEKYFSPFSQHPAIKKCQELIDIDFTFDAPVNYILFHGNPPGLARLGPYSDYLTGRARGVNNLIDFTEKLRDFSTATDFMNFYNSHKIFYDKMLTLAFNRLGDMNYIKLIEDYYGETKYKYIIILTPLFFGGAYGPKVDLPEGQYVYNVPGPSSLNNGIPVFDWEFYFKYVLLHEFSHSFVNPLTEKNIDEVNKSAKLFEPVKDKMKAKAYSNWTTCVNEHLVRINVIRMWIKSEGESIKDELMEYEKSQGFIYISQLDTLMQTYESNRSKYPKYEDFYPEIINLFNNLADIEYSGENF